jgi:chromosome segregation protein
MKITGFKSFVEPTDVPIEPGMTGIVGPNGCGKSNVVEALRWTMGENSAKRLRGSEMDDVIFSGSAGRPSRNIAEVTLILDNQQRTALSEFNNDDEIEVTRRIERGMGSDYRINGRPVRQKDVQLLFADQATGAHSTSIVSQGRVAALISAKPEERRQVLEEAAGVSGLHARRHEAELKLKAAEANLARVGDQLQTMDVQLRGLKTQVRQTSRYRNLGDLIRKSEAGVLFLKSKAAAESLQGAETAFHASETEVQGLVSGVAEASARVAENASLLPPLRQAEAAASAVVQRLFLERETLEREAKRLKDAQESIVRRIEEVKGDRAREEQLVWEAEASLTSLASEKEEARLRLASFEADGPQLAERTAEARAASDAEEKAFHVKTTQLAEISAKQITLTREIESLSARQEILSNKIGEAEKDVIRLRDDAQQMDAQALEGRMKEAEKLVSERQEASVAAQEKRRECEAAVSTARAARDMASAEKTKIEAEIEALNAFLSQGSEADPLSAKVTVASGFEAALAAALGEGFFATLETNAKVFWQDLGGVGFMGAPGFPRGVDPILQHVEAPAALKRALSFVGVVAEEDGDMLARDLKPGQILVSREGGFWRWDGYTQRKDAETSSAIRAKQLVRMKEAEKRLAAQAPQLAEAEENLQGAEADATAANAAVEAAANAVQEAFMAANEARQKHGETSAKRAETDTRIAAISENIAGYRADYNAGAAALEKLEAEQKALPTQETLDADMQAAREVVSAARAKLIEAEATQASFDASLNNLRTRLQTAVEAESSWKQRAETSAKHLESLATRQQSLESEGAALAERPAQIEAERQELLTKSSAAEEARRSAADTLLAAEQQQAELERKMRSNEEALMAAKETRVRHEEQMYRAKGAHDELALRIREHWHCAPEELPAKAELKMEGEDAPTLDALENDLARFTRERENMGPVNLRAEIEAGEIEGAMDKIGADKADLEGAIAKLRQGIASLNREARDRLATAFTEVDKNFTSLFERLFGGGRAYLKLIESDDPLEAGLEIYASPPGKRLQVMSLLSGGEQALTALSLLFAIFLVNPSPICVLDEVDAPLDEANVDRFCTMVREMAESGKTRFLVITHHRLTMARMDRLFGVTMAEKGVSQIVSVDLKQAIAMREQSGGEQPTSYGDVQAAE